MPCLTRWTSSAASASLPAGCWKPASMACAAVCIFPADGSAPVKTLRITAPAWKAWPFTRRRPTMRRAESPAVQRSLGLYLLATATLALAPFLPALPVGVAVLATLMLAWRGWLTWQDRAIPHRAVLIPIALIGAAITVFEYHQLFGRQPGLAMLALLLPLKLLETRKQRDARAALLLCCFLMTGQFLNEQTLFVAASVLACALAILATSAHIERPTLPVARQLRLGLRLLGTAIPLTLLLFVLFPRVDGPLWGMPGDAFTGVTGLSNEMQPGSISELVQSGEIAFRVDFAGDPPPARERYWRGPVLTRFDGRRWQRSDNMLRNEPPYAVQGPAYRYTMTLEPHYQGWLLAMDYPLADGQRGALYGHDFTLMARRPVSARQRLELVSYPATPVGLHEWPGALKAALSLPDNNPRTRAAGEALAAAHADPAARVDAGIALMRDARLQYTLYPPLAQAHPADEFLFDSKRGFCEHFASTFVVLMRAADVPARVVTGYQGGEFNPVDGSLVVRQSDAHAWAEVWIAGRGWLRVDPTATSAPERIDGGLSRALSSSEPRPLFMREALAMLRALRHRWEALNNSWNQ
ncbi:MAG: transglutaminase [Candidatus Dactylopiibacterium carminicum]|uniref:DUF3488 domain-containing protein n=2 Tax=Candidatus Dactylopiibacterium carminicum TaxID=857335 RepID=A0A272ES38_9RHOO|nr:DUF3488 domain-containing protein [Candidatus Dactylopiibacterium carminicum]PAS92856.1 MAG: transglutaminase [Candidatus Dactylopiibacterium carminicum]